MKTITDKQIKLIIALSEKKQDNKEHLELVSNVYNWDMDTAFFWIEKLKDVALKQVSLKIYNINKKISDDPQKFLENKKAISQANDNDFKSYHERRLEKAFLAHDVNEIILAYLTLQEISGYKNEKIESIISKHDKIMRKPKLTKEQNQEMLDTKIQNEKEQAKLEKIRKRLWNKQLLLVKNTRDSS